MKYKPMHLLYKMVYYTYFHSRRHAGHFITAYQFAIINPFYNTGI